jgi:hypothetical protein
MGTGKTVFVDMLEEIVGHDFSYRTGDMRELRSQYTDALIENLMVNLDDFWWTQSLDGRIKGWITCERQSVRKVGHSPAMIKSCTRYVITGGNDFLIRIPDGDRRYFTVRLSDKRKGDRDFFAGLIGTREGKERLVQIAPYLLHFFQTFEIQRWRPYPFLQTAEYLAHKRKQRGVYAEYLTDVLQGRIDGVYFWNSDMRAYSAGVPAADWAHPYDRSIGARDFELELKACIRYTRECGEYLFVRVKDLSKGFDSYAKRNISHVIGNALRAGVGKKNVGSLRVNGVKSSVKDYWYVIKKEKMQRWLLSG